MNAVQHPSDELDRFIDALLDPAAPAPAPPAAIDAASAHLVHELHALGRAAPLRPAFRDELATLLNLAAVPAPEPTAPGGNGRVELVAPTPRSPAEQRRRHTGWLGRVAAVAVLAVAVALALQTLPRQAADGDDANCYVSSLGFWPCAAPDLISPAPAAATRGELRLTVSRLLATAERTTVELEIEGLPPDPYAPALRQAVLYLRDEQGRRYSLLPQDHASGVGPAEAVAPWLTGAVRSQFAFEPLPAQTRVAEVVVEAPAPLGAWRVPVPVSRVADVAVPATPPRGAEANVQRNGLTVRLVGLVADRERTAVRLAVDAGSAALFVYFTAAPPTPALALGVAAPAAGAALPSLVVGLPGVPIPPDASAESLPESWPVGATQGLTAAPLAPSEAPTATLPFGIKLQDDLGREYGELPYPGTHLTKRGDRFHVSLLFPPLASDARTARLVLPHAVVTEQTSPTSVTVPARGPSDRLLPLNAQLQLGSHTLGVRAARLLPAGRLHQLALNMDPLPESLPRQFVGPGQVQVVGQRDVGFTVLPAAWNPADLFPSLPGGASAAGQTAAPDTPGWSAGIRIPGPSADLAAPWMLLSGPLSLADSERLTVEFRNAVVQVDGPWQLEFAARPAP